MSSDNNWSAAFGEPPASGHERGEFFQWINSVDYSLGSGSVDEERIHLLLPGMTASLPNSKGPQSSKKVECPTFFPFFPNRQLPPCPARTVSCDADSFNKSAVRRPRRAATSCCPPSLVGMSTIAQRSPQRRATPGFARHLRLIPEGNVYFSSRRISGIVSQRESNAQHAPHSRPEQSLQDCAMSPPQLRVATCRGKPGIW